MVDCLPDLLEHRCREGRYELTRIAYVVTRYPWIVVLVAFALTAVFFVGAQEVTITTDIKSFFPQDDVRVVTYNRIDEEFGGAEMIMVAVEADTIFDSALLARLDDLTRTLEDISGIATVQSLTNVAEMRLGDFGIEMASLMDGVPATEAELAEFARKVLSDDFYRGNVVSADGTAALIALQLDYAADKPVVVQAVQRAVAEAAAEDLNIYVTGTPVLNEVLVSSMQADLQRLIPLVLLIVAFVLFTYFRTVRGVLLPFLTVGISVVWTIGLMGYLGKHLSPLSAVMPVILISLGNAYAIYVITRHNEEAQSNSEQAATGLTLRSVGVAVLMAGTTTVAGFLSNAGSSITLMREFGLFTAFGVATALLISLTVVPALLTVLPEPRMALRTSRAPARGSASSRRGRARFVPLQGLLRGIAAVSTRRPRLVIGFSIMLVIVAGIGVTRLTSDSNFFNFFDQSSEARLAYDVVRDKFGGSETVEVAVTGDLKDPELLLALDGIAGQMEGIEALTRPVSAVDVVRRIDAAIAGTDVAAGQIPDSGDHVAQYYLLAEMDADSMLSRFVNIDYTQGRIQARTSDTSPSGVASLTEIIDAAIADDLPADASATVTGMVVLLDALNEMLVNGQIVSLLLSFLMVFVIVRLLLRSWEGSVLAVTVVAVVTVANFGLMGWLGIPLDIVTVLISSIGVGVGIDFSIHIYSRFQEEVRCHQSNSDALRTAITSTGRAVLANTGGVIAGFAVLTSSSFPPLRYFGILVTFSMAMAALGALSLLPAALAWRESRTFDLQGQGKVMNR